ncbi:MAG: GtrA family protein [Jhaorihella sp.]
MSRGPADTRPGIAALTLRYALFAVLASMANLAAQRLVFASVDHDNSLILALIAGTGVGLVSKYMLDKRWIFYDRRRALADETRVFVLYSLTGVGTTLIFWGSETLFWLIWHSQSMREAGAVLGLAAGYVIKYRLDRRYVFGDRH